MKKQIEVDAIQRRKYLQERYEQHKILKMQDEEIRRLNNELNVIKRVIQEKQNKKSDAIVDKLTRPNSSKTQMKMNTLSELKQRIKSIKQETKRKCLEERKAHSREMNDLTIGQFDLMNQLRKEYQTKIDANNQIKDCSCNDMITLQIIRNIDQTNAEIRRVLRNGAKTLEMRIEAALEKEKLNIERLREKEVVLKTSIQDEQKKLIEGKSLNEQRVANAKKTLRARMFNSKKLSSNIEEKLLIENAEQISTLNELTENEMAKLDPLRESVREQKQRVISGRTRIRDQQIDFSNQVQNLQVTLGTLSSDLESSESLRKPLNSKIIAAEERCQEAEEQLFSLKEKLKSLNESKKVIEENNDCLRKEIARLDRRIYGNGSKYQRQSDTKISGSMEKKKRRPFVPVGVFSN